jgi:hypothetical protein
MLKHNDSLQERLSYLALQGGYDIDSAKVFNVLSAAKTLLKWRRAHLLRLHHCLKERFFRPVLQQVHHLSESLVCGVWRNIKFTSLWDESVNFAIPKFGQLLHTQIEDDWGHDGSWPVLGYDQNILLDCVFIKRQNGLFYYCQPFHCPISVGCLWLDCKVEYLDTNQWIMPEFHNIWVQYMDSYRDNTFQGRVPSFPVLSFIWTPPNQIIQFLVHLPVGWSISTFSMRSWITKQWKLRPQPQGYAVLIPTKYKDANDWADCSNGFSRVVKQTDKTHIIAVWEVVGPAHSVQVNNVASDRIDSVWLVYNPVDLDTYWTVY